MAKGELSINMIVLIAIGILVLLLIIFGVSKGWGNFSDKSSCISNGGVCKASSDCGSSSAEYIYVDGKIPCTNSNYICCPIGE